MTKYEGVDGFVEGLGCTVRECIDCAALIAGGPTRCIRCAKEGPPRHPLHRRLYFRVVPRRVRLWRLGREGRKIREQREAVVSRIGRKA